MLNYRSLTADDDAVLASIIRTSLEQMRLNLPGTAYSDPELDHLSAYYAREPKKRTYFVALDDAGQVVGGVGVAEFAPIPNCAEIQKLYLSDAVRGKGYGKELMRLAETWAKEAGYRQLYLETHSNLQLRSSSIKSLALRRLSGPRKCCTARWITFISSICDRVRYVGNVSTSIKEGDA